MRYCFRYSRQVLVVGFFVVLLLALFVSVANAQQALLQSGPMVGYSDMREVQLWVQTKAPAKVKVVYWELEKPSHKYHSEELLSDAATVFCVKLLANKVEPGKKYQYEVYINSKLLKFSYPLRFQTLPLYQHRYSAPDFSFALGSCAYVNDSVYDRPGTSFGGGYGIYASIHQKKPDFMLWMGDNVYLREPDWNSKTGIAYRYTHARALPELQPLLASVHHYAIWDDHDYGPDDADRSFWNKGLSQEVFQNFWCNPNTNLTGKGGITGTFVWNDCQFFLLDDRWFRSPNKRKDEKRVFLGEEQVEWLIDALLYSKATFKFVCVGGQVLNPVATKENYSTYREEYDHLLRKLDDAKIKGVVFLTGDRHHTELTKLPRNSTYPLYDLTVSPLLSRVNSYDEPNYLRIEGTVVREKNFGVVNVVGGEKDRKLVISIYDAQGEIKWEKEIKASELK